MLSSGRSSEYEIDADGNDVTVVVAGRGNPDGVVEDFLSATGEHAVIAILGIDALVLALDHDGRRGLIVQAQGPGALTATVVVQLCVGDMRQEVTETTDAHQVERVDGLHVIDRK